VTFDFKKEYRALYQPGTTPSIVTVPKMNYLAVRGIGDPNQAGGEYKESIELLYGIAYTLKMSKKSSHTIAGFFDYVVPPLEGFWWQSNGQSYMDYTRKQDMHFISLIRLPDFVTKEDFDWAVATATAKKKNRILKQVRGKKRLQQVKVRFLLTQGGMQILFQQSTQG